jgi:hypothetical protein
MKYILFLLVIVVSFSSCSSSKRSSGSAKAASEIVDNTGRDGSNFEKAIIIDKTNSMEGIAAEYQWRREHYPGYKMIRQSLVTNNRKPFDVLEFKTQDGETKRIYFDISRFFGKF